MTYNIKKHTRKFFLLSAAALFAAGCGDSATKTELDKLKEEKQALEARLKVAKQNAPHAFKAGLGAVRQVVVAKKSEFTSEVDCSKISLGEKVDLLYKGSIDSLEKLNTSLTYGIYEFKEPEYNKAKKSTTGALVAFFYPLFDELVEEFEKNNKNSETTATSKWISLTRIMLECKESLAKLVEKPSDYTPDKLKKILDDCEQQLKAAPELIIDATDDHKLKEKPDGTPQDYYEEASVKEAFDAFKKEVAKLQKDYEHVVLDTTKKTPAKKDEKKGNA